jgi:hypothetical protein
VVSCPDCGLVLQTLDLPCPACSAPRLEFDETDWTLHEYSKTFQTRHLVRPKTDAFVAQLNLWLAEQPGLVHVAPIIHFDNHGVARGATLTCTASSRPALETFQFFRLPLHRFFGRPRKDIGSDLNRWADRHPDLTRVSHQVTKSYGVPVECWVLARGPAVPVPQALVPPQEVKKGDIRVATTGRVVVSILVFLALVATFMVIGAVTGTLVWTGPVTLVGALLGTRALFRLASCTKAEHRQPT